MVGAAGPSTAQLLNAAQQTIEALTEELVQVRQENEELKSQLLASNRALHMQKLAAMDNAALVESRHQGSTSTPSSSRRSGPVSSVTATTPVARAKLMLRMTPPPFTHESSSRDQSPAPREISTIVMTDDERDEVGGAAPAHHQSASSSKRPRRVPATPPPRQRVDVPSAATDVEAYVADLRAALAAMSDHAAKKQARAAKLEAELQNALEARAKDMEAAGELRRLLEVARNSEEGARRAAGAAKREVAKVREECETIRRVAAQTIEELAMRLKETVAASAATARGEGSGSPKASPR